MRRMAALEAKDRLDALKRSLLRNEIIKGVDDVAAGRTVEGRKAFRRVRKLLARPTA
jgi:hypothetical protein